MYEFLIVNLRNCAETNSLSRYKRELMLQAANAIEELSKELMDLKLLTCCCCEPPKEETE